jgi:hypothetical protein
MGKACSKRGRDEKCLQNFMSRNVAGRDHLGDLSINGRIILKFILKIGYEDVNWSHLVQD